jgi:hypothetical protein
LAKVRPFIEHSEKSIGTTIFLKLIVCELPLRLGADAAQQLRFTAHFLPLPAELPRSAQASDVIDFRARSDVELVSHVLAA